MTSGKLVPAQVVERLLSLDPKQLEEQPFGPLFLVVKAPDDDPTEVLIQDLAQRTLDGAESAPQGAAWLATSEFPTLGMAATDPVEVDVVELLAELGSALHAVVPLTPCPGSSVLGVGRAGDADICLNHLAVSAHHAEFVFDGGGVKIRDLDSKNGTRLNDTRLVAHRERWLQPMDRLNFGRVETFLCDPRALRAVLLQDLRTLL